MEIWASVDQENIQEQSNVVVLCNDGRGDLYCLIIWNASVLLLDCFSFERCNVGSIYF
jgi:hypothetical protein